MADAGVGGIAREHDAVSASQRHRKTPFTADRLVEADQVVDIDRGDNDTEEAAVRSADPAGEKDRHHARGAGDVRYADKKPAVRVVTSVLEVVAVGDNDPRQWVQVARRAQHVALGTDQRERVGLGQVLHLRHQVPVGGFAGQPAIERVGRAEVQFPAVRLHFPQQQIDHVDVACRLRCKHDANGPRVVGCFLQRPAMHIPDGETGPNQREHGKGGTDDPYLPRDARPAGADRLGRRACQGHHAAVAWPRHQHRTGRLVSAAIALSTDGIGEL
jgi:hypothetical protein